jgi:hypothetical protein
VGEGVQKFEFTTRETAYCKSTRLPGHGCVFVYIYNITAARNSVSSKLGSSCQGNRYSTEKTSGTARLSRTKSHLPGHSPPASQAGRRVGPALYPSVSLFTTATNYEVVFKIFNFIKTLFSDTARQLLKALTKDYCTFLLCICQIKHENDLCNVFHFV